VGRSGGKAEDQILGGFELGAEFVMAVADEQRDVPATGAEDICGRRNAQGVHIARNQRECRRFALPMIDAIGRAATVAQVGIDARCPDCRLKKRDLVGIPECADLLGDGAKACGEEPVQPLQRVIKTFEGRGGLFFAARGQGHSRGENGLFVAGLAHFDGAACDLIQHFCRQSRHMFPRHESALTAG
jgi:hypothetical protein